MVPQSVLRLEEDIWSVSIAQRMSWAAHRATTRPEDEAYCLMGIFDINMPTLYGEGRNAFRRLQEEIMRKSIDTSLFAWSVRPWDRTSGEIVASWPGDDHLEYDELSLLAPGPARYLFSSRGPLPSSWVFSLCFVGSRPKSLSVSHKPFQPVSIPTFEITPYGIHARIPVVYIRNVAIAILFVSDSRAGLLGLFLHKCKGAADPLRPLFHTCVLSGGWARRLVSISGLLERWPQYRGQFSSAPWRDIYFVHIPSRPRTTGRLLVKRGRSAAFHIPQRLLSKRFKAGFGLSIPRDLRFPWLGHPPVTFALHIRDGRTHVVVQLVWGSDLQVPARPEPRGFGPASDGRGLVKPQAGPPGRLRPSPRLGPAWAAAFVD
ncbi:hypothetical protein K466DRAFT_600914 [Polyporus arcularius HHB13444]|uniref:DUF8212 domain-containing protein n=1 Tax=Polyporus arcularius HHB13444 TaxID=1314778 RepID=A0A5C3P7T6_9APHY|nr:hypothetical protein K466DRAFT_600914 [Polyporus arcularius HHB13444]